MSCWHLQPMPLSSDSMSGLMGVWRKLPSRRVWRSNFTILSIMSLPTSERPWKACWNRFTKRSFRDAPKSGSFLKFQSRYNRRLLCDGRENRPQRRRKVGQGRVVVYDGKLGSLKRLKDDAREVLSGFECGIGIENFNDIHEGDLIESYVNERVERKL